MAAELAVAVVEDPARFLVDVAVEKVAERPLADEADAGRVLLLRVGQADFLGDAPHFGLVQLAHGEQRLGQLGLVQAVQEIALVLGRVQPFEQLEALRLQVLAHARIVAGRDLLGAQAHGVVEKGLELDFGVAQHVGVGRAPGLVLAQKFGEHPVLVLGGEVDVLDLDADHVGHGGRVDEVDIRRTEFAVVVIFPVLHEDADHVMALLLEQIGGHRRIHAA
ncbi:hypothetical protein D3C78_1243660 [compost metagenome]